MRRSSGTSREIRPSRLSEVATQRYVSPVSGCRFPPTDLWLCFNSVLTRIVSTADTLQCVNGAANFSTSSSSKLVLRWEEALKKLPESEQKKLDEDRVETEGQPMLDALYPSFQAKRKLEAVEKMAAELFRTGRG